MPRNQIKAYVSHPIRGKYGINATHQQMVDNNNKAIKFGIFIKKTFPAIQWYVPADHNELVIIAFEKGYLNEGTILDIDCSIIDTCNFMLVFSPDDYISRGMKIEINHCTKTHKTIVQTPLDGNYDEYIKNLVEAVNCYLITLMR